MKRKAFILAAVVFITYCLRAIALGIGIMLFGSWYAAFALAYAFHLFDAAFLYKKFRALA